MKKGDLFPIAANGSFQPIPEIKKFSVQFTGEYRKPKKGEFFISGAGPDGWLAPHDSKRAFHIGRLVEVKEIRQETIVRAGQFRSRKFFELRACGV